MQEFADDKYKFDENDRKFSKQVENAVSNFSFTPSVFIRHVLQTRKHQGFFGKKVHVLAAI